MGSRLSLLTVHAHPDDESSKGAGSVALYASQGIHTTLVCCTGGEEGDILNPAMDQPEVREHIGDVRRDELAAATKIIGYDEVVMLGYRDSGMPDSEANANPAAFANAPLDEAVGRLVEVIRRERPQVVVTYGDDQQGYPHPDHLRVHDISVPAFDAGRRPRRLPRAGRAVAAVQALLHDVVAGPGARHPREVPRARPRVALRRGLVQAPEPGAAHHDLDPARRRASPTCGPTRFGPTPPRSTRPRRSGSGCRREVMRDDPSLRRLRAGPQPGRARDPRDRSLRRPALSVAQPLVPGGGRTTSEV